MQTQQQTVDEKPGWRKLPSGEWELKIGFYIVRIDKVDASWIYPYQVRLYFVGKDLPIRFVGETKLLSRAMILGEAAINASVVS